MNSEQETYLVEGEFAFTSYMPTELKVGMQFITRITAGVLDPEYLFFTLQEVPEDAEMYMSLYGAPVVLHIVSTDESGEALADPKEIGWFNDGENILPITDKEINVIINEDEGFMDVECDDTGDVILLDGKVIISYLSSEEEEDLP
jgi:hypothetical protein